MKNKNEVTGNLLLGCGTRGVGMQQAQKGAQSLRRSLARRREMWPTWSTTSPSENARRQSLSVSVISGEAVVQQEDPDHTAAQWSRTGLPSSPNCCQVAARPHASESGTNTD